METVSRDRIVVSTLRCGRNNPGSNPGLGIVCLWKKNASYEMLKNANKSRAFRHVQRSHLNVMAHVIFFVIRRSITYCLPLALLRGRQPNFVTLT